MLRVALSSLQIGELITSQQELYRPACARSALDELSLLQDDDRVVDGRGRHPEVALHVRFSGRDAVEFGVVEDERQVLALRRGIAGFHPGIVDGRRLLVNGSAGTHIAPGVRVRETPGRPRRWRGQR
jgi:hypothetical protein